MRNSKYESILPFLFWSSLVKYYFVNLVRGKGGTPKIHNFFADHMEYLVS